MIYTDSGFPLITDGNAVEVVDEARAIDGGMGYDGSLAGPFGSSAPPKAIRRIPASERMDHYRRQQAEQSSPYHWWQAGGCKILSQGSWGYCWMFGTVGGMQCAYAQTGIQSPHLNAHYPAWLGKNGANRGGWAGEALGYIERFGVPEYGVFPGKPTSRAAYDRREARDNANLHKAVEFTELPRNDYDALCSVLLDPIDPRPVTLGLNWWGHLTVALQWTPDGILIANSWGESWGKNGFGVLAPSKSVAFEQIAIERVTLRAA
jgi:hypothetical protein